MKTVTATQFVRNFGRYAAQSEPVAVSNHGRTAGYFISEAAYQSLRAGQRRVWRVVDMPREMIEAIRDARAPSKREQRKALRGEG